MSLVLKFGETMDAYHIAGDEPISLWGERRGPSYELVC